MASTCFKGIDGTSEARLLDRFEAAIKSRAAGNAFASVFLVALVLLVFCTLSACTATGLQSHGHISELTQVRRLRVSVLGSDKLSVLLVSNRGGLVGGLLLGVMGSAVEYGYRASIDKSIAEELAKQVGDFHVLQQLQSHLTQNLRASGQFESVVPISTDEMASVILEPEVRIEVKRWGLGPALVRDTTRELVQVGFEVNAKALLANASEPVWELRDLYLHGKEHPLAEYQSDRDLLYIELNEATKEVAIRLSNAIRNACR